MIDSNIRTCTNCNEAKPVNRFSPDPRTKDGVSRRCDVCRKQSYLPMMRSSEKAKGCVYLLQAENGLVKIGISTNIEIRLRGMQNASPIAIKLLAYADVPQPGVLENQLHIKYGQYHHHGEWLSIPDDLLSQLIAELKP